MRQPLLIPIPPLPGQFKIQAPREQGGGGWAATCAELAAGSVSGGWGVELGTPSCPRLQISRDPAMTRTTQRFPVLMAGFVALPPAEGGTHPCH